MRYNGGSTFLLFKGNTPMSSTLYGPPEVTPDPLEVLCAAAGVAVGAWVGDGWTGALVGGFAARLMKRIIVAPDALAYKALSKFTSGTTDALVKRIHARLHKASPPQVGDALQRALCKAMRAAVVEIGGPRTFPYEPVSATDLPSDIVFRNLPSQSHLWRDESGNGKRVDAFLVALAAQVAHPTKLSRDVDVQQFMYADRPRVLTDGFYEAAVAPLQLKYAGLEQDVPAFFKHLRTHLFARTFANLDTLLEADEEAWQRLQGLVITEILTEIRKLREDATATAEMAALEERFTLALDDVKQLSERLVAQLVAVGRSDALMAGSFDEFFVRLTDFEIGVNKKLDTLQGGQEKGFAEVKQSVESIIAMLRSSQPSAALHAGVPRRQRTLFGREMMLKTIGDRLLRGEDVAVYGEGGIGKTALAVDIANDARLLVHFDGGVLWGSPGPYTNIDEVLNQWAAVLHVDVTPLASREQRAQALKNAIGQRAFLLILDDCWEETTELLCCGGPRCAHLITTRLPSVAHKLVGSRERTLEVTRLSADAAYLLLEEIAPVAWGAHEAAMRDLAAKVGYRPLELELVANFLSQESYITFSDSVGEGLRELDEPATRIKLAQERLGGKGQRQDFGEVVELSLTRLPATAVAAFYALGAFAPQPASFDREAALEVTGATLRDLALLIDRCLLVMDEDKRLSLHQSVTYVARHSPDFSVEASSHHADYYLHLAQQNGDDYQRIEAVYEQIQQAWAALPKDDVRVYDFVNALEAYQVRRAHWAEQLAWVKRTLRLAQRINDYHTQAGMLNNLGLAYDRLGKWQWAVACLRESLRISNAIDDLLTKAKTYNNLGEIYTRHGSWDKATAAFEKSLTIKSAFDDTIGIGTTLMNLGIIYQSRQAPAYLEIALGYYQEALAIFQRENAPKYEANTLTALSTLLCILEEWDDALQYLDAAVEINTRLGDLSGQAYALYNLGIAYGQLGEWEDAMVNLKEAVVILNKVGHTEIEGQAYFYMGEAAAFMGNEDEAYNYWEMALTKLDPESEQYEAATDYLATRGE
jgi:tetratricopeptide (TPR) repeat protein